jgi:DNA-binding MarR family transcriptional regulator
MNLRRLRREAQRDDRSWTRLQLLGAIGRAGNEATPTTLAQSESLRSSNLAAALWDLEADGLIVRTPDAEDGRKVRVRLTQTGRGLLQENVARRERWLKEALEKSLTDEERALLFKAGELLDRLAAYSGSRSSQRDRLRAPAHFMSLQSSGRPEANRRTGFKPRAGS